MLLSRNVTALDQPARTRVMAPESCVTVEELPGGGVELVGRDKAGVVRMRMECERVEAVVRWSIKVVRLGLAVHYDAGESGIRLLGS